MPCRQGWFSETAEVAMSNLQDKQIPERGMGIVTTVVEDLLSALVWSVLEVANAGHRIADNLETRRTE
jgi:hypothetical protein